MARFVTLTLSARQDQTSEIQAELKQRLDGYGATETLFAVAGAFVSVSFVLHGAYATDEAQPQIQSSLVRAIREYRTSEFMMTSEPLVEA